MAKKTPEEQKAYNRAKTAKHRAKIGREAVNAQSRMLYHKNDDDPELLAAAKEQRSANGKRWYVNHAAEKITKVMERSAKRKEDPELAEIDRLINLKAGRKWRKTHPEKQKAFDQAWKAAHPEQINATRRKRNAEHPEKDRAIQATRRARKKNAPVNDFTAAQWKALQEACNHCCGYCGKRAKGHLTQDHITPLSQGGSHTLSNIIPACKSCNSKKGTGAVLKPIQPFLLI